jgi:hypothetical protein
VGRCPSRSVPAALRVATESVIRSRVISSPIGAKAAITVNTIEPIGVEVFTFPRPGRAPAASGWVMQGHAPDRSGWRLVVPHGAVVPCGSGGRGLDRCQGGVELTDEVAQALNLLR